MKLIEYKDIVSSDDEITVAFTLVESHLTLSAFICSPEKPSATPALEFFLSFCSPCCNSMIIPNRKKSTQACSACFQTYPLTNVNPDFSWAPALRYDHKPLLTDFLHHNLNYNGNNDPLSNHFAAQIATPLFDELSNYLWGSIRDYGTVITETLYSDVIYVLDKLDHELTATNLF